MKTAILISNLRFGGAEVQTVELANNLSALGDEVLLITMDADLSIRERAAPGVRIVVLGKKYYADPKVLKKLVVLLREFKPESFIMVNSYPAIYGYLASLFTGRRFKMVNIQHTTLHKGFVDALQNMYYMPAIRRMDHVVFVSANQMEHWIRKYRIRSENAVVIHNGIDMSRFEGFSADTAALRESYGFEPSDVVVGVSANLRPEKKHEDLIEALVSLRSRGYPVKLLFIGDGVQRKYLENIILEKGVESHVVITGFMQDIRPALSCVDISALTSTAVETLSIAIIESMAMVKPIVMSNIGGAAELVEDGQNGFLYEAGNVAQLVEAISKIVDGELFEEMGRKSFERAKRLFHTTGMVNKYVGLLNDRSNTVTAEG